MRPLLLSFFLLTALGMAQTYDLVVYGGTAGGVVAATAAARRGLHVALLEPGSHLGGMTTGGLSRTDLGKKEVIGGMALEFYWRAGRKYDVARFANDVAWYFEPHVGEQVLREMASQAGVTVMFHKRLKEQGGVIKQGTTVTAVVMEDGTSVRGRLFADCTYEGDLMAQAKISYTFGRESSDEYGESLAGVRDRTPFHQFQVPIAARDPNGALLPEVSAQPRGKTGSADRKVQAYNFRLILSDDPANQIPFPKPQHYDPHRYEILARLLPAMQAKLGRALTLNDVTNPLVIPNHKADVNNNGAFSTDFIGGSWEYPEGSYARRAEIFQAHVEYTQGFFYFLAHDPRVPKSLQDDVNRWGLAKDEFQDTDHWPNQLYIREARRMVGEFVVTQKDLQTDRTKPDPIGMGSYNSDSHNVQRFVNAEGNVENEGDMQVPVQPYQIPYRVMVPKRSEATNLLVPVCFSASHVAYSSLRMEPQYMIIGQAAGIAAAMALSAGASVQDVDTAALTAQLRKDGAIMEYTPAAVPSGFFSDLYRRFGGGK